MGKILFLRVFVVLLILFSLFSLSPIIIALVYGETDLIVDFALPAAIILILGLPTLFFTKNYKEKVNLKQSLLLVPLCWIVVSIVGSIPYMLSGVIPDFSSALFESSSGLTTTGASILLDVESTPKSILFWRALTHWLGGMGIIVLMVALFPQAGMGGNIMLAAESPGPTLEKITPKINAMAKTFWLLYTLLTLSEIVLLMLGGMHWFDAVTHSFATLATGGFSTKNNSIMTYEYSPYIQLVITIFMVFAGINFAMYFAMLKRNFKLILQDTELRIYLTILLCATLVVTFNLLLYTPAKQETALRDAAFQVVSIATTTGFSSVDFATWPFFSQGMLFLLMFVGGCAGSTGGGIKVVRIIIIIKYIRREVVKLFSPRRIQHVKLNNKVVGDDYIKLVLFFVSCYILLLLLVTIVVTLDNHDILTAFTTSLATLGNIGPGFGAIGPTHNYSLFSSWLKVFLSLVMITGRLELFTVLIIFSPRFWK